jgi:hypothetical protein
MGFDGFTLVSSRRETLKEKVSAFFHERNERRRRELAQKIKHEERKEADAEKMRRRYGPSFELHLPRWFILGEDLDNRKGESR